MGFCDFGKLGVLDILRSGPRTAGSTGTVLFSQTGANGKPAASPTGADSGLSVEDAGLPSETIVFSVRSFVYLNE